MEDKTALESVRASLGMSVEEFYAIPRDPPSDSKLPIYDASHVRNAMARFNQLTDVTDAEKAKARRKIIARAKHFGIDTTSFEKETGKSDNIIFQIKSNFELKDADLKTSTITGYCAIFNNIDSDKDMTMPQAFDKTLAERGVGSQKLRIKHLWQHDSMNPIGIPQVLRPDAKGLYFESKIGKDQYSQDRLQQHIDGIISEMSFGYNVLRSEDQKDGDGNLICRKLLELKLWEYSSVTWGANSLTSIISAKGEVKDIYANLYKRLDALNRGLKNGRYTDESCEAFEAEILKIQSIMKEIESLKVTDEPLVDSTQKEDEPIVENTKVLESILLILKNH